MPPVLLLTLYLRIIRIMILIILVRMCESCLEKLPEALPNLCICVYEQGFPLLVALLLLYSLSMWCVDVKGS